MPDTHAFPIQNVIAPGFDRPETLYFSAPERAPGCRGALPWNMATGHSLSTDTYLNSFFYQFWDSYANIGQIGLEIETDETVTVSIMAVSDGSPKDIAQYAGAGQHIIWLTDLPEGTGRLAFSMVANADVTISRLRWVTNSAPKRAVSLSIGLCTFNREPFLADTVAALVQQREKTPEIEAIWVVNQGARFTDPALLENAKLDFVTVLEQPNLGGCGGFNRSMLESVSAEKPTTHHILMDDDIVLDPRVIDRVVLFLGYCGDNYALGGQMLEIERPTHLHEAGGRLHPLWFIDPVGHKLKMDRPESLDLFDETPEIDYNAWWFCVIPTRVIRLVGLSPPLFIRGDDIEYGCRMKAAGVQSIPLPGCVVWHEGFAYKTSDWLLYYDLRNRLILAGLHPNAVSPPDALYLLGYCMSILFQHRYRATEVALKAISDALGAPELALGPDGATRHEALGAWLKNIPEPVVFTAKNLPAHEMREKVPLDPSVFAMIQMCVKGGVALHIARLMPRRVPLCFNQLPDAPSIGARDYLAARDPEGTEFTLHKSDLRNFWRLLFKSIWICSKFLLKSKKMNAIYRDELEIMRSKENWTKSFGKTD
ncbi:MAG: galactofuranosylgalactofuranosylrhamnosyl-N-acetylglucosaminyl-diphospho-decaprenol beta-1,5 [Halocynthiibacter sp.]